MQNQTIYTKSKNKLVWYGFILFTTVILCVVLLNIRSVLAATGTNEQINYQGRLLTNTGAVAPDGNYNIEFKIYQDGDGVLGGGDETLKWTETRTGANKVTVKNGYFSVYLGSITAFASNIDWNQDTLWLSINIGGTGAPSYDGEMSPFTRFSSTPYALNSKLLGGLDKNGFVQLGQGSIQAINIGTSAVAINQQGAGNLLQLQSGGVDALIVSSAGDITFGQNANHALSVSATAANAVGKSLTISSGNAGSGATGFAGGDLILQAGSAAGTTGDANGGSVTISGGAKVNSGTVGAVVLQGTNGGRVGIGTTGPDRTLDILDASNPQLRLTQADGTVYSDLQTDSNGYLNVTSTGNRITIGTADTTATLLVLDTKTDAEGGLGGVNGAMYYNSNSNKFRCYQNSGWTDCIGAGGSTSLQQAYDTSGGAAPSILTTGANKAFTVQTANTGGISAGNELFGVRLNQSGDTIGNSIFTVNSIGLGINIGGTGNPATTADLSFGLGANRVINVIDQTAADTVGVNLSVISGKGSGTGNGGTLNLQGGNGGNVAFGTPGNGGNVEIQGGNGGSGSFAPGNGGDVVITGGGGDAGGNVYISGGEESGIVPGNVLLATARGKVGIGITNPGRQLDILHAANPQLRLSQANGTVYSDLQTDSNGYLNLTNTGNRITIGAVNTTATLLVLDTKTDAEGGLGGVNGAMYYNSNSNKFRCYQNGAWTDCITTGSGGSSRVTLIPEYPGAVLTADGTNNTGTMTSDFCSGTSRRSINTSICAATQEHNYYSWTSASGDNDYDIYIRYQLTQATNDTVSTFNVFGWRTDNTNNLVEVAIYNASGNQCGATTNVATGTAVWTETAIASVSGDTDCDMSANDIIVIRIRMVASASEFARVGEFRIDH